MRAIAVVLVLINLAVWLAPRLLPGPEVEDAAAASALPEDGPSLRLLSEAGDDLPQRRPAEAGPLPDASLEKPLCTLAGPFAGIEQAERFAEQLRALDVGASARNLEVSDGTGFWVHLPPELSEREALRRLHELQSRDIDSYVIPRGELENGISFGMFTREKLAEARQDELVEQGYDARIRRIERTHRETWVSMPAEQAAGVGESRWRTLLERNPDIGRQQNFCPGVASG